MRSSDLGQLLRVVADETGAAPESIDVLTHRPGRLVARAGLPSGDEVVVKVAAESFAPEADAVAALRAAGLPVSQVRAVRDGPPGVIVLDWTPGRAVRSDDPAEVKRAVADILTTIHALPAAPPYGQLNADLVTWMDGWCNHTFHRWDQRDGAAQRWYRQVRPLIAGRTGSMIMLDGVPDHFIVGPDARVRLIDVTQLQPGDPVMDLAVLELHAPGLLSGVLDRYDQAEVDARHLTGLLPFYVFLRALTAAEWNAEVLHDEAGRDGWLRRAENVMVSR